MNSPIIFSRSPIDGDGKENCMMKMKAYNSKECGNNYNIDTKILGCNNIVYFITEKIQMPRN